MLPALASYPAFVAGLVDSVVGGGGLIQTPALFLLLPGARVPTVLGTGKVASLAGTAAAAVTYARRVALDWPVTRRSTTSSWAEATARWRWARSTRTS